MAKNEVTGLTAPELEQRKETYEARRRKRNETDERPPFEDRFCLAHLNKQPDDYNGPQRYCLKYGTDEFANGRTHCKFHGRNLHIGGIEDNMENPELAGMKHGMFAEVENLVKDFSEKDQALYDWITERYSEAYGIDPKSDPAAAYDMHRLAAEIVRAERGRGWLIQEGEVHEKEVRDDEGRIVIDRETGDVVTEKSEHYLAKMMHRQDKKISQLERDLLVTRKERSKQESVDDAVEAMKTFSELGSSLISRDENEYNPDEFEE